MFTRRRIAPDDDTWTYVIGLLVRLDRDLALGLFDGDPIAKREAAALRREAQYFCNSSLSFG